MDVKVEDLPDFDNDLLITCLEKLNLDSIPLDISEMLRSLDGDSLECSTDLEQESLHSQDTSKSAPSRLDEETKNPSPGPVGCLVKCSVNRPEKNFSNENICDANFEKSQWRSKPCDYDDDESSDELIERGADRNRRKTKNRPKVYDRQSTDTSQIPPQKLLYLSAGRVQINDPFQPSPQLVVNDSFYNWDSNHLRTADTNHAGGMSASSEESGYDTSPTSCSSLELADEFSTNSNKVSEPSSKVLEHSNEVSGLSNEVLELSSIVEEVNSLSLEMWGGNPRRNVPLLEDAEDSDDYIAKVKIFLQEQEFVLPPGADENLYSLFSASDLSSGYFLESLFNENGAAPWEVSMASFADCGRCSGEDAANRVGLPNTRVLSLCERIPKSADITYKLKSDAKQELFHSPSFSVEKCNKESIKLLRMIRRLEQAQSEEHARKKLKVIHTVEEPETDKLLKRTNLHVAVLTSNVEMIYSIVEVLKIYSQDTQSDVSLSDINIRDGQKKTALDYAKEQDSPLVVAYLIESTAVPTVSV